MNTWLGTYEPVWLFYILLGELLFSMATFAILVKEYFYDLEKDKNRPARRTRKKKVVVRMEDGQAKIIEQPKDVEVTLESR